MKRCLIAVTTMLLVASFGFGQGGKMQVNRDKEQALSIFEDNLSRVSPGFMSLREAARVQRDQAESLGGKGPSSNVIQLSAIDIGQLEDFPGFNRSDLCRLSYTVYPDVNEASNIYYYYPNRWHLHFEPDEGGYHFRIDYKASSGDSTGVLLMAQLTPGYDEQDVKFLGALLEEHLRSEPGNPGTPKLLPLPASIEASFHLSEGWDVEEVTILAVEPDTNTIHLSISADVPTKELVASTLIHEQLPGNVTLIPDVWGQEQTLENTLVGYAQIRLGDIAGGPALRWPRSDSGEYGEFVNEWPFDMRLDYLVYLYDNPRGGLELRGWDLGGQTIGPGDTARIPVARLNSEFSGDHSAGALFLAKLNPSEDVSRGVLDSHTGGVGLTPNETLVLDLMQADALFDQYSIYKIVVQVRSAHFDMEGREVVSKAYELDGSETTLEADTLWLWEDPSGADLYHYRIGVVTDDGTMHAGRSWNRPEDFSPYTINIGSTQVEAVLAE
jgi:hypothetical protein